MVAEDCDKSKDDMDEITMDGRYKRSGRICFRFARGILTTRILSFDIFHGQVDQFMRFGSWMIARNDDSFGAFMRNSRELRLPVKILALNPLFSFYNSAVNLRN